MHAAIRLFVVAVIIFPVAVCLFGFRAGVNMMGFQDSLQNVRRGEAIEYCRRRNFQRDKSLQEVARELIDQRCSLDQALEQVKKVQREWIEDLENVCPEYSHDLAEYCQEAWSDPHWFFWRLTQEVKWTLFERPVEAVAVLRRLEEEHLLLQTREKTPSPPAPAAPEPYCG